jgi:O-antigen ligase
MDVRRVGPKPEALALFWGFSLFTLLAVVCAIVSGYYILALSPVLPLIIYWSIVDFRAVFFFMLFCVPLSTELHFPNGLATDIPAEPLIVGLMIVFLLFVACHPRRINGRFIRHPITLLLALHLGWMAATVITAENMLVSLKFMLAKTWYVITFYFLAAHILRRDKDWRLFFWAIFPPLLLTVLVVLFRHAQLGFGFASANKVLFPFYRNHVAYAAIMAVFFPYLWRALLHYDLKGRIGFLLASSALLILAATYFSYTRAAYVALLAAAGAYYIIRLRLVRPVILSGAALAVLMWAYMAHNNRFMDYAPNYERTVTHYRFDNLIEATYQGEDISTMERVHRWIAGFNMLAERPWMGFGPGNFSGSYRTYTVKGFQTYVSDNPDDSGIHNYYLMIGVEQGLPGLLLFLLLVFFILSRGEALYHRLHDTGSRLTVMAAMLSLIVILTLLIINDLIETDKVGPFFFISLALLTNIDLASERKDNVD